MVLKFIKKINNRTEYKTNDYFDNYSEYHILELIENEWEHYSRDSWEIKQYPSKLDDTALKVLEELQLIQIKILKKLDRKFEKICFRKN